MDPPRQRNQSIIFTIIFGWPILLTKMDTFQILFLHTMSTDTSYIRFFKFQANWPKIHTISLNWSQVICIGSMDNGCGGSIFFAGGVCGGLHAAGVYLIIDSVHKWLHNLCLIFNKHDISVQCWFNFGPPSWEPIYHFCCRWSSLCHDLDCRLFWRWQKWLWSPHMVAPSTPMHGDLVITSSHCLVKPWDNGALYRQKAVSAY